MPGEVKVHHDQRDDPSDASPAAGRARALGTSALVLTLALPGLLTWCWSRPIAAAPTELPALALPADEVAEQLAEDAERAASVPASEAVEARLAVYRETNRAELDPRDHPGAARQRHTRLTEALARVSAEHGEDAVAALRASDLERAMRVLRGEAEGQDRGAELGAFVDALERYGMIARGRQAASRFVIRTAFKARWNAAHERPLTEGFGELERRAYWGWLALGAEGAPLASRLEGLESYEAAGGANAAEARAILSLEAGRDEDAAAAFEEAYAARPTFRLRNHLLAAGQE